MSDLSISPKLVVSDADRAIAFYAAVLGADPRSRFVVGESVVFAALQVGDSVLQLKDADEHDPAPATGGSGVILDILTPDPDALMARALEHGAEVVFDVAEMPYGPRQGRFRDPFGHQWIIGTPITLTDEEVQYALDDMQAGPADEVLPPSPGGMDGAGEDGRGEVRPPSPDGMDGAGQSGEDEEIPLPGGDVTEGVVRVGGTVRRPLGEHSPLVHRVLRHLEEVGFEGAPRLLGIDDRGREILTFVEGEVAGRPWPAWVGDEDRAVSVAQLLRRLDDALAPLGVGHMDVTPENTVFRDGRAQALIDFDLAREATPVEEVTNLLLWWGAWLPVEDRDPVQRGIDAAARGRVLVDAYGLDEDQRAQVVPVAIAGAERSWHRMKERAERQGGGWARMWDAGAGDQIRRRQRWLHEHGPALAAALLA